MCLLSRKQGPVFAARTRILQVAAPSKVLVVLANGNPFCFRRPSSVMFRGKFCL